MSSLYLVRMAAALAAVASMSATSVPASAGGCGCEAPSQTVYHVHQRCHHHCRQAPPVGMLVPAAPMMVAPMMAAPAMVATPVMVAPTATQMVPAFGVNFAAPAQSLAVPQATLQLSVAQQPQASAATVSQDQLLKALSALAGNASASNCSGASASAAAQNGGRTAEERLAELERRMQKLESNTENIVNLIDAMQKNK